MDEPLYLRYREPAKPTQANRDAEGGVGDWLAAGTATIAQSNTYAHSGTYSYRGGFPDGGTVTTNYVYLASNKNHTFVIGRKYCLTVWAYKNDAADQQVKFKTGGVESDWYSIPNAVWTRCMFIFTATEEDSELRWCGADDVNTYLDDFKLTEVVELSALTERGMTHPDDYDLWEGDKQRRYLDGTIEETMTGFRRRIWFDCGSVHDAEDRKGIIRWLLDNDRTVDYLTEVDMPMSLEDVNGFENEWLYDCSLMRSYQFRILEPTIRTTFPV